MLTSRRCKPSSWSIYCLDSLDRILNGSITRYSGLGTVGALRVTGSISEFSEAASQSPGVPEVIEVVGMMIVAEKHNIEAQGVGRFRSVTGPVVYSPPAGSR